MKGYDLEVVRVLDQNDKDMAEGPIGPGGWSNEKHWAKVYWLHQMLSFMSNVIHNLI